MRHSRKTGDCSRKRRRDGRCSRQRGKTTATSTTARSGEKVTGTGQVPFRATDLPEKITGSKRCLSCLFPFSKVSGDSIRKEARAELLAQAGIQDPAVEAGVEHSAVETRIVEPTVETRVEHPTVKARVEPTLETGTHAALE